MELGEEVGEAQAEGGDEVAVRARDDEAAAAERLRSRRRDEEAGAGAPLMYNVVHSAKAHPSGAKRRLAAPEQRAGSTSLASNGPHQLQP